MGAGLNGIIFDDLEWPCEVYQSDWVTLSKYRVCLSGEECPFIKWD